MPGLPLNLSPSSHDVANVVPALKLAAPKASKSLLKQVSKQQVLLLEVYTSGIPMESSGSPMWQVDGTASERRRYVGGTVK